MRRRLEKLRLPALCIFGVIAVTIYQLHHQGRQWICSCGRVRLWNGDVWSAENSQQLLDPYSFTHVLHGMIFYALFAWLLPRWNFARRLALAVVFEALWEIVENTEAVINRYRGVTAAIGYHGDTILNSLGDILCFGIGFAAARRLGALGGVVVFVATEVLLVLWIKDSLILNVIMLLSPSEAIRSWQMAH
ncbi:MAG TPA: DUF2585 family protein [Candidatus Binatia bacterium]|jgi:hypothetical protein